MAELAKQKLREKIPQLQLALEGKVEGHHRFLLKLQLDRLKAVEENLATLEQHLRQKLEPYSTQLALLMAVDSFELFGRHLRIRVWKFQPVVGKAASQ
jgi:transposase